MHATVPLNIYNYGDEDSADLANDGSGTCGFAWPLRSGLSEDGILREGSGGEMVSSASIYVTN